jgi:hypothetical protein
MSANKPPRFKNAQDEMQWIAVQRAGAPAVRAFNSMISRGESVRIAAMLAVRKAPTAGICDRVLHANTPSVQEQFRGCEPMLNLYRNNYRRLTGEDLPADAVVYRGLARFPGDPAAIVTHKHPLDSVKQAMRDRNCTVEGDWEIHPKQQAPVVRQDRMSEYAMQHIQEVYAQTGEFDGVDPRDVREEILHRHAAPDVTADQMMKAPVIDDPGKLGSIKKAASKIPLLREGL